MRFIEHIIEPTSLLMTWQSADKQYCTRYIIAELNRTSEKISLKYFTGSADFNRARELGFESYPAFRDVNEIHQNGVLDALMRRLPPKSRSDYAQYLEGFRIKFGTELSDFALLGYTGAKLPSDGFAIINPFSNVDLFFEFLLEAAGYRYIQGVKINIDDRVTFKREFDSGRLEDVIKIFVGEQHVGYVTRSLIPSFHEWMSSGRILDGWIEKINGSPDQPVVYLYVKISSK